MNVTGLLYMTIPSQDVYPTIRIINLLDLLKGANRHLFTQKTVPSYRMQLSLNARKPVRRLVRATSFAYHRILRAGLVIILSNICCFRHGKWYVIIPMSRSLTTLQFLYEIPKQL